MHKSLGLNRCVIYITIDGTEHLVKFLYNLQQKRVKGQLRGALPCSSNGVAMFEPVDLTVGRNWRKGAWHISR